MRRYRHYTMAFIILALAFLVISAYKIFVK